MNSINWQNEYQENPFCTFLNSAHSDAEKKALLFIQLELY
jgi:hypothetical protein